MSVLTCPVCQAAMREQSTGGVIIDVCTRCRGVWLDRGELEKLADAVGGGPPSDPRGGFAQRYDAPPSRDWNRDDDDDDRRRDPQGKPQKSKVSRFLDFFD